MLVLNKLCKKCNYICNAIYFQQNFENWTSGNNDIDKLIQDTQLLVHNNYPSKALEWIPYDRLKNIKYIAEDKFGKVYKASWINGYISNWDYDIQNWKRINKNMFVAMKSLNNSKRITIKFINEV